MTTEITRTDKQETPLAKFSAFLERCKDQIAKVLPKHLTAERVVKVAISATMKCPELLECETNSVYLAIHQSAQLGLEPGGPLGHSYLLPFNDRKTGKKLCQLIIGYRGMIDLARRSGQIASLEAHVVHERDKFALAYGLAPRLEHEPRLDGDPGAPVFAYAVAHLVGGGVQCEVMSKHQIEAIRGRSRAGTSGPWVTDWEEMARKTVVRRLFKYLPCSVEMAGAVEAEEQAEAEADAKAIPTTATATVEVAPPKARKAKADAAPEPLPDAPDPATGEVAPDLGHDARALAEQITGAGSAQEKKDLDGRVRAALVDGSITGEEAGILRGMLARGNGTAATVGA